ncbi:EAL domain-containing protein [uncultured Jatrophihabitans sp.]|uniref:sensor domain-containing phosphodiesterase n=1 Tax=uncultured Jatrophihabitans sp. TaxID=1610747 RepID=UPI0035CB5D98
MTSETVPAEGRVQSVYQPIVELATERVVGYEALARWMSPGLEVAPDFANSADLNEIEWACRTAALAGALDAGLDRGTLLFVNVEPRILARRAPQAFIDVFGRARRDLQIVVELTERDLLNSPGELFAFADLIRRLGWSLALDDVGVHTESLAALPFLDPDVVKLDISLVQNDPTAEQARTLTGVLAHSERMGTALLAEGIETPAHLERARTLGAVYGQGYLFGRPGPLPTVRPTAPLRPPGVGRHRSADDGAPGGLLQAVETRIARKPMLLQLSRQLEQQACNPADPSMVLATLQEAERLTPAGDRFRSLAAVCRFVGVLGVGMPAEPMPGVRGAAVAPDDPLTTEWTVVVVGAHYAGALIAREIHDGDEPVTESDRRYEFVLTHDRDTVLAAGRHLLRRFERVPG